MGTHVRVLSESYPMKTNMIGVRWFSKNLCILVLWTEVDFALERLNQWQWDDHPITTSRQGLCQDLETGCQILPILKFMGVQIFKGNLNTLRFQP